MEIPRIMIAAGSSGSGKTTITCGLLQALKNRGLSAASFKCGPDYIDPAFHKTIFGTPSKNLDTFFADHCTVRIKTYMASSYELADVTNTPVIFIVNALKHKEF